MNILHEEVLSSPMPIQIGL